jgi:hypothetical protein
MTPTGTSNKIEKAFYYFCAIIIIVSIIGFAKYWFFEKNKEKVPEITVTITGNVKSPGKHKIPWGSTVFDLLQVVGVQPNSDLNQFALAQELNNGEEIKVGQLDKTVSIEKSNKAGACEIDFYKGSVEIKDSQGNARNPSVGMFLQAGDVLSTLQEARFLLKFKDRSSVVIDEESRFRIEKIAEIEEDKNVTKLILFSGKMWATISPQKEDAEFSIETPHLRTIIRGTEFSIEVTSVETTIKLLDGIMFVQSFDGNQGINLIAGQQVIFSGGGRPLRSEELTTYDSDILRSLQSERNLFHEKNKQLSLLFCGIPNTYIYLKMNPVQKNIITIHIPNNTWVGDIVEGFQTFDKAFLYGGAKFTSSITERLLHAKIEKYMIYESRDIIDIIDMVNGIDVDVDSRAASNLNISAGKNHLSGTSVAQFMKYTISGTEDAHFRQRKVLNALFDEIKDKNIILSTSIIAQMIARSTGDFSAGEAVDYYSLFNSVKGWGIKTVSLPGRYITRDGVSYLQANSKAIENLLQ